MVREVMLALVIVFVGSMVGAQSAQPAREIAQIVGTWEGTLLNSGQTFPITLTIHEDGTWDSVVTGLRSGSKFSGTVRVTDGKFRYHTNENKIDGTYTLRDGDGKRVLELLNDPHTTSASMMPKQ
jgi:uncharacterized protein (DUF2147 family)